MNKFIAHIFTQLHLPSDHEVEHIHSVQELRYVLVYPEESYALVRSKAFSTWTTSLDSIAFVSCHLQVVNWKTLSALYFCDIFIIV